MLDALTQRVVIIGNSGAGKSTLAGQLSTLTGAAAFDLDVLHWEEGGYGTKRNEDDARKSVAEIAARPRWIIEGVYGWLAVVALPRASALIWLDLSSADCRANLLTRGPRRGATDQDTAELLTWTEAYWERQTSSSYQGHLRLFDEFPGAKFRLHDREQIARFLAEPGR